METASIKCDRVEMWGIRKILYDQPLSACKESAFCNPHQFAVAAGRSGRFYPGMCRPKGRRYESKSALVRNLGGLRCFVACSNA